MKEVWYVRGADMFDEFPTLFDTKMAAEIFARQEFPNLTEDQRYARVYYKPVWEAADLIEGENK